MKGSEKKYLAKANKALPSTWFIQETKRITSAKIPTFSLTVHYVNDYEWPVLIDQPRRELRKVADDVAVRGLRALLDHGYTARAKEKGNRFWPHLGFREAIVETDPSLYTIVDSIFYCQEYAIPVFGIISDHFFDSEVTIEREKEEKELRDFVVSLGFLSDDFCGQRRNVREYVNVRVYDEKRLASLKLPEGTVVY